MQKEQISIFNWLVTKVQVAYILLVYKTAVRIPIYKNELAHVWPKK